MVGEAAIIAKALGVSRSVTSAAPHGPTAGVSTLTKLANALLKG
jgi:hypothetical protein